MKTFFREPLVHFLLIGGLLFGIFSALGKWTANDASHVIVVTPGMVENLKLSYRRTGGPEPDAAKVEKLIDDFVREEVLCREARALGIDQDDTLVRTILMERMTYMAEAGVQTENPTDSELEAFLAAHADQFKKPDGGVPALADLREQVLSAWQRAKRRAAVDTAYQKMRLRYKVKVQTPPVVATKPS